MAPVPGRQTAAADEDRASRVAADNPERPPRGFTVGEGTEAGRRDRADHRYDDRAGVVVGDLGRQIGAMVLAWRSSKVQRDVPSVTVSSVPASSAGLVYCTSARPSRGDWYHQRMVSDGEPANGAVGAANRRMSRSPRSSPRGRTGGPRKASSRLSPQSGRRVAETVRDDRRPRVSIVPPARPARPPGRVPSFTARRPMPPPAASRRRSSAGSTGSCPCRPARGRRPSRGRARGRRRRSRTRAACRRATT